MRYILYLFLCCATASYSQESPTFLKQKINNLKALKRDPEAEKAIKYLQNNGVLLVRLPSKSKKIEAIDAEIIQFANDEKYVRRLVGMRQKTQNDVNEFNLRVSNALNTFYHFSTIYYIYDTSIVSLINGKRAGFLMNKNLVIQPSLTLEDKHFLILKCEKLSNSPGSSINGFVVADEENKNLAFPFPAVITFNMIVERGKQPKSDQDAMELEYAKTVEVTRSTGIAQFAGKLPSRKKIKRAVNSLNNSFYNYEEKVKELPFQKDKKG